MEPDSLWCRVRQEEGEIVGAGAIVEILTGVELARVDAALAAARAAGRRADNGFVNEVPTTHVVVRFIDGTFADGVKENYDRAVAALGYYAFAVQLVVLQPMTPAAAWHLSRLHWGEPTP